MLNCVTSTGEVVDNCYKIDPPQAIIAPNSEAEFKIRFTPYEPDAYFF
jgi:hypothetical protein